VLKPNSKWNARPRGRHWRKTMNNTAFEILAQWAWAKVNLENNLGEPNVIREYRHWLRKKKKLDAEYREHHEALTQAEDTQVQLL